MTDSYDDKASHVKMGAKMRWLSAGVSTPALKAPVLVSGVSREHSCSRATSGRPSLFSPAMAELGGCGTDSVACAAFSKYFLSLSRKALLATRLVSTL